MNEQDVSAKEAADNPDAPLDFNKLLNFIEDKIVKGRFPPGKLKNRLSNLGVEEFINKEPAIHTYGFPFKFVNHLDEAILAMAHYLHRFRQEGGELRVYGINRLPKGEDKTLSYWQSEKARLYIELQNIILLLNEVAGMRSEVARIFAFRKMDDIAFLTQSAISAMNEQAALDIKVGLLFRESFRPAAKLGTISDTLIIDYKPRKSSKHLHNFYVLRTLLDEANSHDLPYQGRCTARWFTNRADAESKAADTAPLLSLFEAAWEEIGNNPRGIAKYSTYGPSGQELPARRDEREQEEHFKRAAVAMYRAFASTQRFNDLPANRDKPARAIVDRINKTVITNDLIRLERAISAFEKSTTIYAVDPTSVKATLKVHEAEPLYRRWIRTSLNGVLKKGSQKSLNRIYILNDKGELASDEFQALKRIMHYYFDYCNYDLSAMTPVVNAHEEPGPGLPPPWLAGARRALDGRVNIHVTTVSMLEEFSQRKLAPRDEESTAVFNLFRARLPQMLQDVLGITGQNEILLGDAHEALKRLDFLYTGDMIYNFLTDRADLSEQSFEAYLYRESFDVAKERGILFDVPGAWKDSKLKDFSSYQMPHRLTEYASSILDYVGRYGGTVLASEKDKYGDFIGQLRAKLGIPDDPAEQNGDEPAGRDAEATATAPAPGFTEVDTVRLLEARRDIEDALYKYFHPIFSYFYELLEFLSVKVEIFGGAPRRGRVVEPASLDEVFPFNRCRADDGAVEQLNDIIRERLEERLAGGLAKLPKPPLVRRPSEAVAEGGPPLSIFINYASEDRAKVNKLADRLTKAGYDVWLDKTRLAGGEDWNDEIEEKIPGSDFFLRCLSKTAKLKRGVVQRELKLAQEAEKDLPHGTTFIIPVLLDNSEVPRALSRKHVTERLFDGDKWNARGWTELLRSIERAAEKRELRPVQRSPRPRASKRASRSPPPTLDGRRKKR